MALVAGADRRPPEQSRVTDGANDIAIAVGGAALVIISFSVMIWGAVQLAKLAERSSSARDGMIAIPCGAVGIGIGGYISGKIVKSRMQPIIDRLTTERDALRTKNTQLQRELTDITNGMQRQAIEGRSRAFSLSAGDARPPAASAPPFPDPAYA